jgi:hypothetical protein
LALAFFAKTARQPANSISPSTRHLLHLFFKPQEFWTEVFKSALEAGLFSLESEDFLKCRDEEVAQFLTAAARNIATNAKTIDSQDPARLQSERQNNPKKKR